MRPPTKKREFAFTLNDVARLLRTLADQRAAKFGMTRAQWAVLFRLDRTQGLKQCERRPDPDDRRVKRLYLTPAAAPVLERLGDVGEELLGTALAGLGEPVVEQMLENLTAVKENLRQAIQKTQTAFSG